MDVAEEKWNIKGLPMWEGWSGARKGIPVYDAWLDDYNEELGRHRDSIILDLGCGTGANTQYLAERGFRVLSADYSRKALANVRKFIPESRTEYVDMNRPLPFRNGSFHVIIADISLHYFGESSTVSLMGEIRRILKPGGLLLARVSSMNDIYYGAGSGREIQPHFYDHGSYAQRYFDEGDVERFFGIVGRCAYAETAMTRREAYYSHPKMLYQIKAEKI